MFECSNKAWTELDKKEYTKLYYEENREQIRANEKQYREENK